MSQEKVDRYKKDKRNRKKIIRKQKRHHFYSMCAVTILAIAFIGYFGWSIYDAVAPKKEETTTFANKYTAEELQSILAAQTEQNTENVTVTPTETPTDDSNKSTEEESKKKKKKNKNKETEAVTEAATENSDEKGTEQEAQTEANTEDATPTVVE